LKFKVTLYIPTTAMQLDTIIHKHATNLLHVSIFFCHLQAGIQQKLYTILKTRW